MQQKIDENALNNDAAVGREEVVDAGMVHESEHETIRVVVDAVTGGAEASIEVEYEE